MLTCKQASQIISQSYDRRLSWQERWNLRIHLFICDACARFAKQMRFLHQAARRFAQGQIEADEQVRLSAEAADRIKRELDRHP
ncbi:MAG: zf-HC2 domain-containing protein [Pseudomonadota bacterium]